MVSEAGLACYAAAPTGLATVTKNSSMSARPELRRAEIA